MRTQIPTLLLACAALAPLAQADETPLAALEAATQHVVDDVQASVVGLEVERTNYGPRDLTAAERQLLGVVMPYDQRYFTRPDGPSSAAVIAPGVLATSSYNVEGEGEITVLTADGRELSATRLGTDHNLGVTLLKTDPKVGPALSLREVEPKVGEFSILIGRGQNLEPYVTRGIVSGLARFGGDAFAHSARTNYVNTGGVIVGLDGQALGISTQHSHRARQGQNSGVGFAASFHDLKPNLAQLMRGEDVAKRKLPFLGISADPETFNGGEHGVRIGRVVENSSAAKAGLKAGDWIKIFNQVEVQNFLELREEILSLKIGQEIMITIVRDGETLDLTVKLGSREEED
ncbi:MAG: PDZ domain-containing protein [Planctomycetota bacterium]